MSFVDAMYKYIFISCSKNWVWELFTSVKELGLINKTLIKMKMYCVFLHHNWNVSLLNFKLDVKRNISLKLIFIHEGFSHTMSLGNSKSGWVSKIHPRKSYKFMRCGYLTSHSNSKILFTVSIFTCAWT